MTYISHNADQTEKIAEEFISTINNCKVIALYGDLGAGKTAFVRGLARGLGIDAAVTSPTYAIMNEYFGEGRLCHFDMYRICSAQELFALGWYEYLESDACIAVEWSENIESELPDDRINVKITYGNAPGERIIEIYNNRGA